MFPEFREVLDVGTDPPGRFLHRPRDADAESAHRQIGAPGLVLQAGHELQQVLQNPVPAPEPIRGHRSGTHDPTGRIHEPAGESGAPHIHGHDHAGLRPGHADAPITADSSR